MKTKPHHASPDPELWRQQLAQGLAAMQLPLSDPQQQCLVDYLVLLQRWNRVFNLTAIRDPAAMVSRQLLDSLSIVAWVRGPRVLDVGSGAGLPGIPLAIACPAIAFTLLDSNGKKTRFLQQAVAELKLSNVAVVNSRVEQFAAEPRFDQVTSRAFAALDEFLVVTDHLLNPGGGWLAMKGGKEQQGNQPPPGYTCQLHALRVPGGDGQRHLAACGRAD